MKGLKFKKGDLLRLRSEQLKYAKVASIGKDPTGEETGYWCWLGSTIEELERMVRLNPRGYRHGTVRGNRVPFDAQTWFVSELEVEEKIC